MALPSILAKIENEIASLKELNRQDAPTRSRELSIAITNLETGVLWAREAMNRSAGGGL